MPYNHSLNLFELQLPNNNSITDPLLEYLA